MRYLISVDIELPSMPNFLRVKGTDSPAIDVAELSSEQLRALASEWGNALVEHAKKRRERRNDP